MCALVLPAAWHVRRSVRTTVPSPPSPQLARGTLVAAQACALGGAVLLGWYVANTVVHLPALDIPSVLDRALRAGASALAAAAVSVSGFVAQAWCALPPRDPDGEDDADPGGLAYS